MVCLYVFLQQAADLLDPSSCYAAGFDLSVIISSGPVYQAGIGAIFRHQWHFVFKITAKQQNHQTILEYLGRSVYGTNGHLAVECTHFQYYLPDSS